MVFPNSDAMVNDGFDLEKDLKIRIIVTDPILRQLCELFRILIIMEINVVQFVAPLILCHDESGDDGQNVYNK